MRSGPLPFSIDIVLACAALGMGALACTAPPPEPTGLYCLGGARDARRLGEMGGAVLESVAPGASGADVRIVAGPSYELSICARVSRGPSGDALRVRLDVEGAPASGAAIAPEAQEIHCEGDARREGPRLVVEAPTCCHGADCLGRGEDGCAYDAPPIALSIRGDAASLEPFQLRHRGRCGARATTAVRAGAERLSRVEEP